jgi:hypothetical protein
MDVFWQSQNAKKIRLLKNYYMPDTLHLRIKKEYAAALIEDLIKVG